MGYNEDSEIQYLPLAILCLSVFIFPGAAKYEEELPEESLFSAKILEKVTAIEGRLNELTLKVEGMEKRLSRLEKGLSQEVSQPNPIPKRPASKPFDEYIKSPAKDIEIGYGFQGIQVVYESSFGDTLFTGKIRNNTGGDRDILFFEIRAYDEKGELIGQGGFQILHIDKNTNEDFKVTMRGLKARQIARYTITCTRGF